jgi:hypothetical protein
MSFCISAIPYEVAVPSKKSRSCRFRQTRISSSQSDGGCTHTKRDARFGDILAADASAGRPRCLYKQQSLPCLYDLIQLCFRRVAFFSCPFPQPLFLIAYDTPSFIMEHDPEIAALIKKYPSLGKAIETGIEVCRPILSNLNLHR